MYICIQDLFKFFVIYVFCLKKLMCFYFFFNCFCLGGSIWLDVSSSIEGSGSIEATGGLGYRNGFGRGAGGRVFVSCSDLVSFTGSISAYSGSGSSSDLAGCGTVYIEERSSNKTILKIDANNLVPSVSSIGASLGLNASVNLPLVEIVNQGRLVIASWSNVSFEEIQVDSSYPSISVYGPSTLDMTGGDNLTVISNLSLSVYGDVPLETPLYMIGGSLHVDNNLSLSHSISMVDSFLRVGSGRSIASLSLTNSDMAVDRSLGSIVDDVFTILGDLNVMDGSHISLQSRLESSDCFQMEFHVGGHLFIDGSSNLNMNGGGYLKGTGNLCNIIMRCIFVIAEKVMQF